jgi:hypothetical protein
MSPIEIFAVYIRMSFWHNMKGLVTLAVKKVKKQFRESYLKESVFLCSEILHPQAKQTRTLAPRCKTSNVRGKY